MKKQPEITDATREALVNAFFQLAGKKDINRITIREITALAGYNRTTFYRYFEDVYALVEYAEDEFLQSVRRALESHGTEGPVSEGKFFEVVINCFHENRDRISTLMSEQNRSHFLRRIEENITNRLYGAHNNTPKKRIITDIYFYGIFHAISINLQSKDALSDEDLLDIIQTLFNSWYLPEMTKNV
ncbi:MAG: TetR/AcrR family transcriptional regulator [Clostridiales bacterium]|nr:TetR/AcrR family transcriptional regulator [Clostridiales bacterium]